MIKYHPEGVNVYRDGRIETAVSPSGIYKTIAYEILQSHNHAGKENTDQLKLRFDMLTSHDITYVGVIQTLRASTPDYDRFPVPYVLSNCHNSLCAVGGTINADDHVFGLSAAKKYGGIFVPPHMAVIHQYMREKMAGCGKMILGTDSHTRYGALGTMGFGEGGGELVKQLLSRTYDLPLPEVIGIKLTGTPLPWVGPQDVALALIGFVFEKGLVKNKVLEFFGDGIKNLSMDFRNGIDVMTTETACLSSIWVTDEKTEEFFALHGRNGVYKKLEPDDGVYYSGLIEIDLSKIKPMIAMPFHPSNTFAIEDIDKDTFFGQGIIAGCAGGLLENINAAADILENSGVGNGPFNLHVYPASQPVYLSLVENGTTARLMRSGVIMRTAFCGPCFGAGEVPPHNGLSARHVTRNFPNREGSKPGNGQHASVALMDARSIAATAASKGKLTAASEKNTDLKPKPYFFDQKIYAETVYEGFNEPKAGIDLVFGPGIRDWPQLQPLAENLFLTVAAFITDPVTTTDELIPSGEASSFRSNPYALAEFTLSRVDPGYVNRAKEAVLPELFEKIKIDFDKKNTALGSLVYAVKPGDGSAREQAASCQRVLGGLANIAQDYATKRYRTNLVNWGMLPFIFKETPVFETGDVIYIPGIKEAVRKREGGIKAYLVKGSDELIPFTLTLPDLTEGEAEIILAGGLINHYRE
jgi:aconitate hydratase